MTIILRIALIVALALCPFAGAQSFVFNHSAGSYPTQGSGIGIYGCNGYNSFYCQNLLTINPSFQPIMDGQLDVVSSGTTTSYVSTYAYDNATANQLIGWTLTVVCHYNGTNGCSGGAQGCSYPITSNTTSNGTVGMTVNIGTACTASMAAGDIVKRTFNGPSAAADQNHLGWNFQGSATFSIDSALADQEPAPIANLPRNQQCLKVTNASGQYGQVAQYLDGGAGVDYFFSGGYTMGIDVSVQSGTGMAVVMSVARPGETAIISQTVPVSGSTWAHYTATGTGSETSSTVAGTVEVHYQVTGTGSVCLSNASLIENTHTNASPFRDQTISMIKAMNVSALRYNLLNQSGGGGAGCSLDNLLLPTGYRQPCNGQLYGGYTTANLPMGLNDLAQGALAANATVLQVALPPTLTSAELSNLADFYGGSTGTTYGAIRAALGSTATYISQFSKILFDFGNETWNTPSGGMFISGAPYHTSGGMAAIFCQTLKASASWSTSVEKCGANVAQYSGQNNAADIAAVDPSHYIDVLDSSDYSIIGEVSSTQLNDCANPDLWIDSWTEAWANVHDTSIQTQQNLASPGPYNVAHYETSFNAPAGNCSNPQIKGTEEGMGFGITDALTHAYMMEGFPGVGLDWQYWELNGLNRSISQPTLFTYSSTVTYWIGDLVTSGGSTYTSIQNNNLNQSVTNTAYYLPYTYSSGTTYPQYAVVFDGSSHYYASLTAGNAGNALTNVSFWTPMATLVAGWGAYPGSGGNFVNARPTVYAQAAANACEKLGTGYNLVASGVPTYSPIARNSIPAESNVPLVKAFDYSNGTTECIAFFNLDTASSHAVSTSGAFAPQNTVTQTLFTSGNLQDNNETIPNNVQLSVSSAAAASSYTLAPKSLTTLSFPVGTTVVRQVI